MIWFGFIFSFILKSLLDLRDQYISSRWRSLKKSVYLFRWNPGSTQDISCKLQTKPKNSLMIEMWIRCCVLLQKGQLFQLPYLCRRALYFMIQACCEHSPFAALLCSELLPFLGLYLSSRVYGSSRCCKVKSKNPLAAVLQLFWTTSRTRLIPFSFSLFFKKTKLKTSVHSFS